ncbi:hypothetical protein CONPUDRAFT_130315 [Coniophora puteana RWD-64-598 SS2]|uniref:Ubinuclein middle domain-containing protein n=1 Tax=Coniophora puteana (strain RWD-64-598) TaxID=741705 RepID=A0A5M3MDJ3_CONPW|nr:uncharacterized protein CONPUDRAFT_130315 [Coniophora puteana RWD-64-598 SS2]EIW76914.1 hypothetical protein CONPUDRAFT_130315 [Coniophora puteana RWD-64-598 SS2]
MSDDADVEMLDMLPSTPRVNFHHSAPISVPPIAARPIPVSVAPSASRPPLTTLRSTSSSSSSRGTVGAYPAEAGDVEPHLVSGDEGEGSRSGENESASEDEEEGEGEGEEGDEGEEAEGEGEEGEDGEEAEEAEEAEEGDEETDSEEEDDDDSVVEIPPPGQREPSAKPLTTPPAAVPVTSVASASDLPAPPMTAESDMTAVGTDTTEATKASSSKPSSKAVKKKGRPRSPSPGTPPPPPPPPLQTIRLEIRLGGPENYEVDVRALARETGQRPPSPALPTTHLGKHYATDVEHEGGAGGDGTGEGGTGPPEGAKRKRKKKNHASEYYDTADPFIDDSELAIDDRHYFAQTKQQGFYVSSGEVALLKDKTPARKPKSKKSPAHEVPGGANGTHAKPDPARENPVLSSLSVSAALVGSRQPGAPEGKRRKNYTVVEENGKKRKVVDIRDFKPELQTAFDDLKAAISNQTWENKSKFPPTLKPLLAEVALKAVHLGEYDDDFFNLMPVLFPYNRFTMSKLIKRLVFVDHVKILTDEQEKLLAQLAALTKEGFPRAKEEWERAVVQWEKRQEKRSDGTPVAGGPGSDIKDEEMAEPSATANALSTASALDGGADDGGEGREEGAGGMAGRDAHPPAQKYRLTEEMKQIIWQLVLLSNECCRLENEKNELEGNNQIVSEQGTRKVLYQKIVASFPPGWLNSGQISRDVSAMKKKLEKEAMEAEG